MTPRPLEFRDPAAAAALFRRLDAEVARVGRSLTAMHVCGSHEQAIARYGLRSRLPAAFDLRMGPGCPVCVTDAPDVDAAVHLARAGLPVLTYGDMLRVPGGAGSLADAAAEGARVEVVLSATDAVARARAEPVVFFATGFETTAVATAAVLLAEPPPGFAVLSAHKWVPAAMEVVAADPNSRVEGYLAAGHAATITGWGLFAAFVARHRRPVVVTGFEPMDLLAGMIQLAAQIADGRAEVENAFPRCVRRDGNPRALAALNAVFALGDGDWRGIAHVPGGELRLRPAFAARDARVRYAHLLEGAAVPTREDDCRCGAIMTGRATPSDCPLFGGRCTPETPVGACMVSSEGACRIWLEAGASPAPGEPR